MLLEDPGTPEEGYLGGGGGDMGRKGDMGGKGGGGG